MQIQAVIGADEIQILPFMPNYIGSIYKQDCGNYEVTISPSYPFFQFSKNGSSDEQGRAYYDRGTLTAGTVDDIGQYPVTMTFAQDTSIADNGFHQPSRGTIDPISYD